MSYDLQALADRLRDLRTQRGLTLASLGKRSDVAASTLSKIENRQLSPTYTTLLKIARGLDVDMSGLVSVTPPAEFSNGEQALVVHRKADGLRIVTDEYDSIYLCPQLPKKQMLPIITRVRAHARSDFGRLSRHPGEEYIFVLEGAVELHTEAYRPIRLEQGDGVYLNSLIGHAFVSAGAEDALLLGIMFATPAEPAMVSGRASHSSDRSRYWRDAESPGHATAEPQSIRENDCRATNHPLADFACGTVTGRNT